MKKYVLVLILLMFPLASLAEKPQALYSHKLEGKGKSYQIRVFQDYTSTGTKQWAYELTEKHYVWFNTHSFVLYARDLDTNGLPDTWFVPSGGGLPQVIKKVSQYADGWDVAEGILTDRMKVLDRNIAEVFIDALPSFQLISGGTYESLNKEILETQLNLQSMEIMATAEIKEGFVPLSEQIAKWTALSDGWAKLSERISARGISYLIQLALDIPADLVVGLGLGKAFKWGGLVVKKGAKLAGPTAESTLSQMTTVFLKTALGKKINSLYLKYVETLAEKSRASKAMVEKLKNGVEENLLVKTGGKAIRNMTGAAVRATEQSMMARRTLETFTKTIPSMARAGAGQMEYLFLNFDIQFAIELMQRRAALSSPDPQVRAEARKEMLQDVLYMAAETFLQTSITSHYLGDGKFHRSLFFKRVIICGVVSTIDSIAMNLFIKHETDLPRVGFDTAWESVVGNGQTQMDLMVRRVSTDFFNAGGPQAKLIGTGFAIVDQAAGYFLYEVLTHDYEKLKSEGKSPTEIRALLKERIKSYVGLRSEQKNPVTLTPIPIYSNPG